MLKKSPTGTWLPAYVPESRGILMALLMLCSIVNSTTIGYDGSMLNGLNILPSYSDYFVLDAATLALQTASIFIGGSLAALLSGVVCDRLGRRLTLFWSSIISVIGILLQSTAQNIGMFTTARIIIGFGTNMSGVAATIYLSETCAFQWRAWAVGLLNDFFYVGALLAAGVTLGTSAWQSTWAWRAPSILQGIFSLACIAIIPFTPESPRWLVAQGKNREAHVVVAQTNARGDMDDPLVLAGYKQILDTIEYERTVGQSMSPLQIFKTRVNRKRLFLAVQPSVFANAVGNSIATYYLGAELATAGITDSNQQLKANVVMNVFCLAVALAGTHWCAKWGRKPVALGSQVSLTAILFIIGGLTKKYADITEAGGTASKSLSYGTVACMFLFQGAYSFGWTPLFYLYPPEVMNYSMRANGQAFASLISQLFCLLFAFIIPIAIENIGWKLYIANAIWDVAGIVLIWLTWVETKGKSLEEIDAIFEGERHSDAPELEAIRKGQVDSDVLAKAVRDVQTDVVSVHENEKDVEV